VSNIAALLAGGAEKPVGDGVYLERAQPPELVLEEHLRGLVARLPRMVSLRRRWQQLAEQTGAHEAQMQALADEALAAAFRSTCLEMRQHGFTLPLVAKAFAAVREASVRTLGLRHHDVQLIGGWTLLQGRIAEMETGEGKTLVATLAASVGAATGAAVHVITVNDYLAKRDAEYGEPLYRFLGLDVGLIQQDLRPPERREQYARAVVYVSNKELVFDYLKDRIAAGHLLANHLQLRRLAQPGRSAGVILRGLHLAIVDEADSVLIDEARTPLIISETRSDALGAELYATAIGLAQRMALGEHFEISARNELWLKPAAEPAMQELTAGMSGVWASAIWRRELLQKALNALHCYQRDRHYIVVDNKVQIVDEFTGRVMPDRSWEQGLHQMIEAKESCEITGERKTLERMTYQRFFRRYLLLAGMTGTATEVAPELSRVYDLDVVRIPTNKPSRREYLSPDCWRSDDERWAAVAHRAVNLSRERRAVLVGTRSVEASERLGALLTERGVEHAVLNARHDSREAEAVANAGQTGRITVATNMAGRGTDIQPSEEVLSQGGLHVILTEYHESARVDRQLCGRCARQGQPGSVEAMVSLDDELFKRFAPAWLSLCLRLTAPQGRVPRWLRHLLVRQAQARAERHNRRIRMDTLKQDRKLKTALGFAGKE